ncbi:MAG: hypothetical protein HS115_18440 [Spirochaetales bacterium]|nr:hypothetical protein [Spirochaetales bacterium]
MKRYLPLLLTLFSGCLLWDRLELPSDSVPRPAIEARLEQMFVGSFLLALTSRGLPGDLQGPAMEKALVGSKMAVALVQFGGATHFSSESVRRCMPVYRELTAGWLLILTEYQVTKQGGFSRDVIDRIFKDSLGPASVLHSFCALEAAGPIVSFDRMNF